MNFIDTASNCDYCLKLFTKFYIKCIDCDNVSLCIECFSYGVQGGTHKKYHSYTIQKVSKFYRSLFNDPQWNTELELKLLSSIELYGLGNWVDIAEKVGNFSPEECRKHYIDNYIEGSLGKRLFKLFIKDKCGVVDHSLNYNENSQQLPVLSPSLYETLPPCSINPEDQVLLGYMPKRGDFEREYDNDAESILWRLKPDFKQDDLLDALKVSHVGIYTQRLKERQKRKIIAREHDLIGPITACTLSKRFKPLQVINNNSNDNNNNNFSSPEPNITPVNEYLKYKSENINSRSCKSKPNIVNSPINKRNSLKMLEEANSKTKPYDAFMLNDELKPFVRYFNYGQAKTLFENLHKEQILKYEINYIKDAMKKGKRRVLDLNFKYPKSQIFVSQRPRVNLKSLHLPLIHSNTNCPEVMPNLNTDSIPSTPNKSSTNASGTTKKKRKSNPYFVVKKHRRRKAA